MPLATKEAFIDISHVAPDLRHPATVTVQAQFLRLKARRGAQVVNRTATFAFYIGDRYFGIITAAVDGPVAQEYRFTSALPIAILKLLAPQLEQRLADPFLDDA